MIPRGATLLVLACTSGCLAGSDRSNQKVVASGIQQGPTLQLEGDTPQLFQIDVRVPAEVIELDPEWRNLTVEAWWDETQATPGIGLLDCESGAAIPAEILDEPDAGWMAAFDTRSLHDCPGPGACKVRLCVAFDPDPAAPIALNWDVNAQLWVRAFFPKKERAIRIAIARP